jgi:hypothetical protein
MGLNVARVSIAKRREPYSSREPCRLSSLGWYEILSLAIKISMEGRARILTFLFGGYYIDDRKA